MEALQVAVGTTKDTATVTGVLHVRQGKGRKDRVVPVRPEVAALVRRYLAATAATWGRAALSSGRTTGPAGKRSRRRLTPRAVAYLVTRCAEAAGIDAKRGSPHSMRHTYALRSLRAGGNVVAVSKLLGHASIATTQRYVDHLATGELRQAVPPLPLERHEGPYNRRMTAGPGHSA